MIHEKYDKEKIYCRKLGHHLLFKYCREENFGLPCKKIRDCWFDKLSIDEFLKENYQSAQIEYLFIPTKPKISSIFDLIQQARERSQ